MTQIRAETPADVNAIYEVNAVAFGNPGEAEIVNELRRQRALVLSLVAEQEGCVVGHIAFSTGRVLGDDNSFEALALGPMSVLPELQNQGIGSQLVRTGLDALRRQGAALVFVLGHPNFYPRFGFRPSLAYGIRCEFDVRPQFFMVLSLSDARLESQQLPSGTFTYHPAFHAP